MEREERKRLEKKEKKDKDEEEERNRWTNNFVKYTLGLKHQVRPVTILIVIKEKRARILIRIKLMLFYFSPLYSDHLNTYFL